MHVVIYSRWWQTYENLKIYNEYLDFFQLNSQLQWMMKNKKKFKETITLQLKNDILQ